MGINKNKWDQLLSNTNLKAVFPVLKGFDFAMPDAAYAAKATGGVMSASTNKNKKCNQRLNTKLCGRQLLQQE